MYEKKEEHMSWGEFREFIIPLAIDRAVFSSNHWFDSEVNFLLTSINTCSCTQRLEAKVPLLSLGVSLDAD
jgi:hypothetical protein